jgi:hypothetical protein
VRAGHERPADLRNLEVRVGLAGKVTPQDLVQGYFLEAMEARALHDGRRFVGVETSLAEGEDQPTARPAGLRHEAEAPFDHCPADVADYPFPHEDGSAAHAKAALG